MSKQEDMKEPKKDKTLVIYYAECPLCGYESPVKATKNKTPYLTCQNCKSRLFAGAHPELFFRISSLKKISSPLPKKGHFWQPDDDLLLREQTTIPQLPIEARNIALKLFWDYINEINCPNPIEFRNKFLKRISGLSNKELKDPIIIKKIIEDTVMGISSEEEKLREEINTLKQQIKELLEIARQQSLQQKPISIKDILKIMNLSGGD